MKNKEFKQAVNIVRKENNYKKPTKKMLIESANRYLHKDESINKIKDLLNGLREL